MNGDDLPVMLTSLVPTYSIVGYDPSNGDLGVAVQSRYFSVGPIVPWAKANVGAIATQAAVNVSYGPRGLQLLKNGYAVKEVIEKLTVDDDIRESRQLGIVNAKGNVAAYTGTNCLEWAGSKVGKYYSTQGNILVGANVVESMGKAYETTGGDLADRLLSALIAGEKAGGDARGRQSAALLVVRENAGWGGFGDKFIELRVEDSKNPVVELKRLLKLQRVYRLIAESESEFAIGHLEGAFQGINEALKINPKCDEAYLTLGSIFLKLERKDEAAEAFKKALSLNPKIIVYLEQLPRLGIPEIPRSFLARLKKTR